MMRPFFNDNLDKLVLTRFDWDMMSSSVHVTLLEANPDRINWDRLSANPYAIHILEANLDKINWHRLSRNSKAIHLLLANPDKIDWPHFTDTLLSVLIFSDREFTINVAVVVNLLETNLDKIDWGILSLNATPHIIHLLEQNPDKIDWKRLSCNRNAIHLLEQNPDKIDWPEVWFNSGIYDTVGLPVLK